MNQTRLWVGIATSACMSFATASDVIKDTQVSLTAKNYYFDRDYTVDVPADAARDWAQGFILNVQSGYTPGKIGFGLDLLGLAGFDLLNDSSEYAASGLLPVDAKGNRPNSYGELRYTVKAKYEKTTLQVGNLSPMFPVIFSTPARLFQQSYRGAYIKSNDFQNLTLHGLYVDRVNHRDSTNYEHIRIGNPNGRFKGAAAGSGLHMLGFDYKLNDQITTTALHANLHDVYQQHYLGLKSKTPLNSDLNLLTDVRLFISEDEGQARAGNIDNQHLSGLFGLNYGQHTLSLGYMQSFGDTAMANLSNAEPAIFMDSISADFTNKDEKVYSVRYDYQFNDTALKGLKLMTRYSKGVDIDLPQFGTKNYEQDAVDFDIGYRIQTGHFEGVNLRARHTRYRNDMPNQGMAFRSDDETRFNIDYTWKF